MMDLTKTMLLEAVALYTEHIYETSAALDPRGTRCYSLLLTLYTKHLLQDLSGREYISQTRRFHHRLPTQQRPSLLNAHR